MQKDRGIHICVLYTKAVFVQNCKEKEKRSETGRSKRWINSLMQLFSWWLIQINEPVHMDMERERVRKGRKWVRAVSYTHLTLPTTAEV